MRRALLLVILIVGMLNPLRAQIFSRVVIFVSSDPAGACANASPLRYNYTNGSLWGCKNGTWTAIATGGGGTGTVTTTGSPASGNLAKFSGATSITNGNLSGDVTTTDTLTATLANIPSGTPMAGSLLATAIAAPGTPAAGKGSIYVDSTSKNIAVKDDAGVVKHGVQTDTGTANNYISAISDAGVISKSQPACATLSNAAASCSTDTTVATNISSGTLPAARLPATVVLTDQSNTFSTGSQSFAAATAFIMRNAAGCAPTATASECFDTTQDAPVVGADSATYFKPRAPSGITANTSDTLVCSTIGAATPTFFTKTLTIPAGALNVVGKQLLTNFITQATSSATGVTFKFDVSLDAVLIYTSGARAANNLTAGTTGFGLETTTTVTGATGNLYSGWTGGEGIASLNGTSDLLNLATLPAVVDLTASHALKVRLTCGSNTAGNSVTLITLAAHILN